MSLKGRVPCQSSHCCHASIPYLCEKPIFQSVGWPGIEFVYVLHFSNFSSRNCQGQFVSLNLFLGKWWHPYSLHPSPHPLKWWRPLWTAPYCNFWTVFDKTRTSGCFFSCHTRKGCGCDTTRSHHRIVSFYLMDKFSLFIETPENKRKNFVKG